MTSSLHQKVRRTLERHGLIPPGGRVLVACSGGSDSVALTFLLADLAAYQRFELAGLAHFNHGLRPAADDDEAFCRALAARLGLQWVADRQDVHRLAEERGLSIENAARQARYDFLGRAAAAVGAEQIAVGHTQDDQAETFLLKLMRGAGAAGLGGIYPRRGLVVRPVLDATRAELRAFLASRGEGWVEDETNSVLDTPRNRLRHEILPALDVVHGGCTRPALARAAELIRDDGEWLDETAGRRFAELADVTASVPEAATEVATKGAAAAPVAGAVMVSLPRAALVAEPLPLRRRLVLRALRHVVRTREVGLVHVDQAMAVLEGLSRGADLPGARVELRRGKLVLLQQGGGT